MLEAILGAILGLWFILTIIHQFEALPSVLSRELGPWAVIPTWRFFAPNPSRWDYYMLYRDREKDGRLTSFHHIPLARNRELRHILWNPEKRRTKVLYDCIRALDTIYRAKANGDKEVNDERTLEGAFPYIVLLNRALQVQKPPAGTHRQVLVVRRDYREDEPKLMPILLSDFYQVPTAASVKSPETVIDS